ncbi:MAG TPA: amidase [Acidobacteriota bacterium]|nr:amidase [Acidobacteriota bacterium]
MDNNCHLTIEALAPLIRSKKLSPVELTRFLLNRISRLQPAINAYITVTADLAMTQARRAEQEIAKGRYRGALHGIPISLKDLFCTRGTRTTAGSQILKRFVPKENAAIVNRLLECGCILLGKTNLHEFAFGATNINPHYGPVHNPWDTRRISGGSSGGSAASVVTAQALASFGTDTGGSIRIPSAACGCVGLKPTYGRVPMSGVIPLAESLDHAGPLSRCVMDAALLLDAIAEPRLWNSDPVRSSAEIRRGAKSLRIGIPRQYFFDRIQPGVRKIVLASIQIFEQLGARVMELKLPGMDETEELAAEITGDEASVYHDKWLKRRPQDYGDDVRLRLLQSGNATAANYICAQKRRLAYTERFTAALEKVDALLSPTLPIAAPRIGQEEIRIGSRVESVRLALLRLTRPGNLTGLPAVSVPCGFLPGGLPVGLQLMGRRFEETTLLRIAHAYEQATPWHLAFPEEDRVASAT